MRNFASLSDIEFEELCADLFTRKLGVPVERFAAGRDQGIDLRWRPATDSIGIAQCKHYVKTSYSGLLRAAKDELSKVEKLSPKHYFFITSQELTVHQKDELYKLFDRWMISTSDVYSGTDIDSLISLHPEVEREHVKLWLNSGTELLNMVHSDVINRSLHLAERAVDDMKYFVRNDNFHTANEILDKNRVCLIAGAPGVGKTMLARALIVDAAQRGYEPIEISSDANEGHQVFDRSRKQIFLFDDFLGQISNIEKVKLNGDQRLFDFMKRVANSPNHLLLLTTREYILREATDMYASLGRIDSDSKFVVEIKSYSREVKAQILYNHLWHSMLSTDQLHEFSGNGWKSIVDHSSFNPRMIEHATDKLKSVSGGQYLSKFREALDRPEELWARAYDYHLNQVQQGILRTLCLFARVPLDSFMDALQVHMDNPDQLNERIINAQLKYLDNSFIRTLRIGETVHIEFYDPSVREFMLSVVGNDRVVLRKMIEKTTSIAELWTLCFSANYNRANNFLMENRNVDGPNFELEPVAYEFKKSVVRLFGSSIYGFPTNTNEYLLTLIAQAPEFLHPPMQWWEEQFEVVKSAWEHGVGRPERIYQLLSAEPIKSIFNADQPEAALALTSLLESFKASDAGDWNSWLDVYEYILCEEIPANAKEDFDVFVENKVSLLDYDSYFDPDGFIEVASRLDATTALDLLSDFEVPHDPDEGFREHSSDGAARALAKLKKESVITQMFDRFK